MQLHAGCPAGVGRLHSQTIKGGLVYLLKPEWKDTSIMKSYTTGQGVGLKSGNGDGLLEQSHMPVGWPLHIDGAVRTAPIEAQPYRSLTTCLENTTFLIFFQ